MDGAEKAKESPRRPVSMWNEALAEMLRRTMTGKRKSSRVTIQEDSAKQLDASLAGIVNASFHLLTGLLEDSFAFSAPSMSMRRQP